MRDIFKNNRFLRVGFFIIAVGIFSGIGFSSHAFSKQIRPLPRMVSLARDEINMRVGPGKGYPILWVYHRHGLPVEIIREFDVWRQIRDWQGTIGWIHSSLLRSKRMIVIKSNAFLYDSSDLTSDKLAKLKPSIVATIVGCRLAWCHVEVKGLEGYVLRKNTWGLYPNEIIKE